MGLTYTKAGFTEVYFPETVTTYHKAGANETSALPGKSDYQ